METQKIVNLLNDSENKSSKLAARKWYISNDQNSGQYGRRDENENDLSIIFETKVIKPNLCDYSGAYILVTGDIKVAAVAADTNIAFENCAPFTRCATHMPMYNIVAIIVTHLEVYGNSKEMSLQ